MQNNILDFTEIKEDDRQVILNQIERINEISLKNQSLTANLILCDYLIANIDYNLIAFDIDTIINSLRNSLTDKTVINKAVDLLVEKDILVKTQNEDKIYYSLNDKYFIENDI